MEAAAAVARSGRWCVSVCTQLLLLVLLLLLLSLLLLSVTLLQMCMSQSGSSLRWPLALFNRKSKRG